MYYYILISAWMVIGVAIFFTLFKFNAPFGKFTTAKWGARMHNRVGWILMEMPALIIFPLIFIFFRDEIAIEPLFLIIAAVWTLHYAHRTCIYPLRIYPRPRSFPVLVAVFGAVYNSVNGLFLGFYYIVIYNASLLSPLRISGIAAGLVIFVIGFVINVYHDNILIHLRKVKGGSDGKYVIPQKGLFTRISSPNLFGETVEWAGFAIMAWSLPALSMAIWTAANLIPRAYNVHRWYHSHFSDYPSRRRPFFPL